VLPTGVRVKKTERKQEQEIMPHDHQEAFFVLVEKFPWLYSQILEEIYKQIKSKDHSLLDVGCGNGALLREIQKKHRWLKLIGVDVDKRAIEVAKEEGGEINYFLQSVYRLKEKADIVICNLSLHHFNELEAAVKSLCNAANRLLIICDQVRPSTEQELAERLERRRKFIKQRLGNFVIPFCNDENEKASILEAFSEEELNKLAEKLSLPRPEFIDKDYYKRAVWVIEK
jgi:SAM-dependent methyltransferase